MVTSLELAAVATLIATVIGTLLAMALVRYEFLGRKTSNLLIVIPIATPEVVIGAALLSMLLLPPFVDFIDLGFQTLVIAHVMFSISFVVIVVRSRLIGFDRSARGGGARPRRRPVHHLPARHAAAAWRRGSSPRRCSPSRSRSTTS